MGVTDFCETGRHRDADESEGTVEIFFGCNVFFFLRKKMFVCKVFVLVTFFCIERNQEKNNMIEIHVHHLCHNKDTYSLDQLMNCSLSHCFHTLSADRLLAVTFIQFMPLSLTHTHTQPRIGLSKLSYTAATLNIRLLL